MTNEITNIHVLQLFETTKSEREQFVLRVVESLDHVDPLRVHLQIKCMEDVIKQMNASQEYKAAVLSEAEKQGGKSFSYGTAKFEIKETGVKYDFSQCNDQALQQMYEQQDKLDKAIKVREAMLKTVPAKGMTITDEETGETYTVYPPSKSSTTAVALTLK